MVPLFSATTVNKNLDLLPIIQNVLDRYWYVLGEEVREFEKEFAAYNGVDYCISVANGTDALELALRALGVQHEDKVVTVANAGFYSSTAIHAIGAVPYYVDVDSDTYTMSVAAFKKALELNPKAVIVTHLYGKLAEIESIYRLAKDANVFVIEDCAQSHGAMRNGRRAGSFGDVACFSFYPTKNLGALGDGGAIITRSKDLTKKIQSLRQYGWSQKYNVEAAGGKNSRLDELQAAVLRQKLPNLDDWNEQRRAIARQYNNEFLDLPIRCPRIVEEDHVAHLYVIEVEKREDFRTFLNERGIATDVHYPIPDHKQQAYIFNHRLSPALKTTEDACERIVTLPCFPGMSDQQIMSVINAVKDFFEK